MNWEEVRREYESSDITMKDLALKHGIKPTTLRSRKNREKWERNESNHVATQRNEKKKNVATQKVTPKTQEVLSESKLQDWEEVFCLEYLTHYNKTKAYQKAKPGTTYASARVLGSSTFAKVNVQDRLRELKQAQREDLYINALDIKEAWARQSFADITDFVEFRKVFVDYQKDDEGMPMLDDEGEMVPFYRNELHFKNSTEIDGTLVQEVKKGKDGVSIKLYDKQKALQELMKLLEGSKGSGNEINIINPWGVEYGPDTD